MFAHHLNKSMTMKLLLVFFISCFTVYITEAQIDPAHQLAEKIAQKMKDTLSLSGQQKKSIKDINLNLNNQKMQARQKYSNRDSVRISLQKIEYTRDTLFSAVLSHQQYILYKQKKRNLFKQ